MAASNRVTYSATAVAGGQHVATAIRYLQLAQQEIDIVMNVANSITAGGVTGANLEGSTEFGIPAGKGAAFYTILNDMKTNIAAMPLGDLYAG